jgi:hypothetical protein
MVKEGSLGLPRIAKVRIFFQLVAAGLGVIFFQGLLEFLRIYWNQLELSGKSGSRRIFSQ